MRLAVLLVAALAVPAAGQGNRGGLCALNVGQLTREHEAYVRSGNMGWEYACFFAQVDVGRRGGWFAGLTLAPTTLYVWPKRGKPINRWSWRPHADGAQSDAPEYVEAPFVWLIPEAGYAFRLAKDHELRVSAVALWPTAVEYSVWGARVGPIPGVAVEKLTFWGPFYLGAKVMAAHKRPAAWVALEDLSTPEAGVYPTHEQWVIPVSVTVGVRW